MKINYQVKPVLDYFVVYNVEKDKIEAVVSTSQEAYKIANKLEPIDDLSPPPCGL